MGVCAAWRRADALCVCVCVRPCFFFFVFVLSLCFFSFLVASSFFFRLLRFFLSCFVFFEFFSGFPLLGGFFPAFSRCLTRAAFINLPPILSLRLVVERNCVGC